MKCVHTLRTGRHKRQADRTLLFQYTSTVYIIIIITHTIWESKPLVAIDNLG